MDSKYCHSCGEQIAKSAPACPKCGAPQPASVSHALSSGAPRSKTVAVILALLIGGFGAHKFYLRKHVSGVLYLLFCWTYIPVFLAVGEGLRYALIKDETFDAEFNGGQPSNQSGPALKVIGVAGAAVMVLLFLGIIAAIVLPTLHDQFSQSKGADASELAAAAPSPKEPRQDYRQYVTNKSFGTDVSAEKFNLTTFFADGRWHDLVVMRDPGTSNTMPLLEMVGTYTLKDNVLTVTRAAMRTTPEAAPSMGVTPTWQPITGSYSTDLIISADAAGFTTQAKTNIVNGKPQSVTGGTTYKNSSPIDASVSARVGAIPNEFFRSAVANDAQVGAAQATPASGAQGGALLGAWQCDVGDLLTDASGKVLRFESGVARSAGIEGFALIFDGTGSVVAKYSDDSGWSGRWTDGEFINPARNQQYKVKWAGSNKFHAIKNQGMPLSDGIVYSMSLSCSK